MAMDTESALIDDLFLLQRVAQKLNSNLDLDALLAEVVNDVSQTFGCSRLAVFLKDDRTNELIVGADCGGDTQQYMKGQRFAIGEYGIVGHVGATGELYYAPDVRVDPYYQMGDEQTRSEVAIPLRSRGQLIGVFNAEHKKVNGFSSGRIKLLEGLAGHITTAIENARMFQHERMEKERLAKDVREAQSIQAALFPAQSPVVPGYTVEGVCLPCREVGGDWYDYISFPDGRLAVVLGDVAGKGMGAALLMSSTRTVLRLIAENGLPPAEVLTRINRVLLSDLPSARFVTMVYGILDPGRRRMVFASAGHLYPLFVDAAGARFLRTDAGLPLGICEGSFAECEVEMKPGSRIAFYSDGVTEAMNSSLEQYGAARLCEHAAQPSTSVQSLLNDIHVFAAGHPALDDITIVMVHARD